MIKTNQEWLAWGKRDPLFAVANWPGREIGGGDQWTPEAFYAIGESEWREFEPLWKRYGVQFGSFVEIGCGAGRITKQLARAFASGHALDISPDMIGIASANVTGRVEFHVTSGSNIPLPDRSIDAVFSCQVFQHFSQPVAWEYLREVARVLKPGGTMMLQLPLYSLPKHASLKAAALLSMLHRNIATPLKAAQIAGQRFMMRFGGTPPMVGTDYEISELSAFLGHAGFERVEYVFFGKGFSAIFASRAHLTTSQ